MVGFLSLAKETFPHRCWCNSHQGSIGVSRAHILELYVGKLYDHTGEAKPSEGGEEVEAEED